MRERSVWWEEKERKWEKAQFSLSQLLSSPSLMKTVGLLSGGKDSVYNLLHCIINNHEPIALASLGPPQGKGYSRLSILLNAPTDVHYLEFRRDRLVHVSNCRSFRSRLHRNSIRSSPLHPYYQWYRSQPFQRVRLSPRTLDRRGKLKRESE